MYIYHFILFIASVAIYIILEGKNYFKKVVGINLMQIAVLMFYIAISKKKDVVVPILSNEAYGSFSSPIPQVLMLTAIVVGIAVLSVALSLIGRINSELGSIEEEYINKLILDEN